MNNYNFGNTFDKSLNKEDDQIFKTPLCLNFGKLKKGKCDLVVLILEHKSFLDIVDFNTNCKGHSSKNKCCWYKAYEIVFRKNGNYRGKNESKN